MGQTGTGILDMLSPDERRPLEWLLVYSLERNRGIDEAWLRQSGLNRQQAEKLLKDNEPVREQIRNLQRIGRLFTLEMLFELLKQRAAEMLARVTTPAEIKSILGTLKLLRSVEMLEQKELAAARQQSLRESAGQLQGKNGNGQLVGSAG